MNHAYRLYVTFENEMERLKSVFHLVRNDYVVSSILSFHKMGVEILNSTPKLNIWLYIKATK